MGGWYYGYPMSHSHAAASVNVARVTATPTRACVRQGMSTPSRRA